ncbi:beta-ketoacyl-[acyl-carrier-protein] synthase family protein [Saccharibacter floricola]|uniref:3-oxoacyl-ACP synthase n=1 Tax=Saccharibacter floricola DSM 15669 TaxID=1123227 RepID=A0ABQ0NZV7_9PROT|nr:beta-ketoacyl-[acyl-carrier-protein] synthase family protein [Saccharibacter floricola]GBQ07002.1 3-oxoacyl-ACP synthase [Saccharibacter floricola DSM 15669]
MNDLIITAGTAVSAMGRGVEATCQTLQSTRTTLQPDQFQPNGRGSIGRVSGIEDHTLPEALALYDCRNNHLANYALTSDGFLDAVIEARNHYGAHRIGIVMGTSTSGILSAEEAYAARPAGELTLPETFHYNTTQDLASLPHFVAARLGLTGPSLTVSNACASSTRAFIDAAHLITSGFCDAVVVGGADSLCRMTLQGFASLELIDPTVTRPCDATRDGISIGEAAGFALLERAGARPLSTTVSGYRLRLLGYGASSDGHHMSAPDPTGAGATQAMTKALKRAQLRPDDIGYINMHGTGSRANDAMEDKAMTALFGPHTPCSSTKGWSGHTLGASGILETMVCAIVLNQHFLPPCMNSTDIDPTFHSDMLLTHRHAAPQIVMNNAFGFGGTNSSLIVGTMA